MAWAKVDDGWWCHPKVMGLGLAARGLWVSALSWSCAQRRDVVPPTFPAMVGGSNNEADALVAAGLWAEDDSGWRIHDWAQYQEQSLSEKRAEAGRKGGQRSGESRRRAKQTGSKPEARAEAGTHPVPSQPDPPLSSQSDPPPEPTGPYRPVLERARAACTLIGERRAAPKIATGAVGNPDGYRRACVDGAVSDHLADAQGIARDHPDLTDEQIADRLDTSRVASASESTHPAVVAQRMRDEGESDAAPAAGAEHVRSSMAEARRALAEAQS